MQRNTFPTVRDLPELAPADAKAALADLRRFVNAGLADVYTAAGSNGHRWNIWWHRLAWPIGEQRVELPVWATAWVTSQHDGPEGGDAA